MRAAGDQSQQSWEWVRERRRARGGRRRLVGLARLSSDHTLVAVLSDVVVLPELRNQGLGRSLLRRLVNLVSRPLPAYAILISCLGLIWSGGQLRAPFSNDILSQHVQLVLKCCALDR